MKMTGAQAVLQSLIHEGVKVLFGYPGGAIMPVYDALHDLRQDLQHILVRHEQGAVHAAEGYARITGKAGVCIATSGPGATNLVTGITDAMLDSVPLVCITGQVFSDLLGTDAFQEADIIGMTLPITKWCYQITCPEEIPGMIAKAFHIANSGRPGPVLLDITKDAQVGMLNFSYKTFEKTLVNSDPSIAEKLKEAAHLINQAKKPYLFAGHGVLIANAEEALMDFALKTQTPVACTLLGLSAFPQSNSLYAGLLGMHGNYGANILTNQADLIIAVGMRFDDRVTGKLDSYARQAKIIHIDIDPSEIQKNVPVDVSLVMDAKQALQALLPLVKTNQHEVWLSKFKACDQKEKNEVMHGETHVIEGPIKMAEVIHQLSKKTKGQSILVTDVGQNQMMAARYYQFESQNAHITSGGLGTMGFALPAAIGAKFAALELNDSREVIVIVGDGGFQMNIQELGVIAQEKLPVKILILNNQYLGMVRQWQELFFEERYSFTELKNPDFLKIAQAYGISAERVDERENLNQGLSNLLQAKTSYLLEVVVEKQGKVFPMIPTGAGVGEIRLS